MKTFLPLLSLLFGFSNAFAALPFYEPFADQTGNGGTLYSVGSGLANQTNSGNFWQLINSAAGDPQPTIASGNLSWPAFPSSLGNSISIVPASAEGARLNINATVTSGRTYYSFLVKITNIDALPTAAANNWFSGFGDGPGAQSSPLLRVGAKILTKKSGLGYVFGTGKTSDTATYVYDTAVHNVNETVFVVAAWEQLAGVATNALLWVNPDPSSFGTSTPPAPTVSVSTVGAPAQGVLNNSGVRAFVLACQNPDAPTAIVDELRIGTNWSDVTVLGDPAVLQNPASLTLPPGANATFNVTATGTAPLTYQWVKDGNVLLSDGGNISGAHTATLHVNSISAGDVGIYSLIVTNGLGSFVQSLGASLSLSDPAIIGQPQSRTNNYGTTSTFTVVASGTTPFSYQWHKEGVGDLSDGSNISGSQSATLTLSGVSVSDAGNYSVTVTNSHGASESAVAVLTVKDPYIVTQPVSVTNVPSANVQFHVVANGTGPLSYQWRKGGGYIFDVGNYSGTTTDTLTVSGISAADEGNYSVVVIGGLATIEYSVDASLTVLSPVSITSHPVSRTVAEGVQVSFGVGATGTAPLNYQWLLNGNVVPGATSASFITNAQLAAGGNYSVIVSNSVNSVTSAPALLTVATNLQLFETNLVVVRVGDAAQALTVNGNSIFLDQFDINGNYVNTVNIPDDGTSGMVAIGWDNMTGVNNGSTTGTSLTRSLDKRFMVVAGYNTNRNYGADLSASTSVNVPRGIGLINSHAQYTMPVASTTAFNATFWRAAVTDGTNNFWGAGGTGGIQYLGFDATAAQVQNTLPNLRSMGLFNGNLYGVSAGGMTGVVKVNELAKVSGSSTYLFAGSSGSYDCVVSPDGNLIYMADQRSLASGGGIMRFDFDGSNWALTYTLQIGGQGPGTHGPRYLTADFSGPNPVIYTTSNDGTFDNNRILKVVDTGADSTATTLAYAGPNQTFRGIHFGPVASAPIITQPTLTLSRDGDNVILSWSGSFSLQSSANIDGPYLDVSGATSPYTNSVNSNAQIFYRLHQSGQ